MTTGIPRAVRDIPLAKLDLSARARNCLINACYSYPERYVAETLGDFLDWVVAQEPMKARLSLVKNLGQMTEDEILNEFRKRGVPPVLLNILAWGTPGEAKQRDAVCPTCHGKGTVKRMLPR